MKTMIKNKKKIIISLLCLFVIFGGYLLYEKNILPGFYRELPNCLALRSGTGVVRIHYSDAFLLDKTIYPKDSKNEYTKNLEGDLAVQIRFYRDENHSSDYDNIFTITSDQNFPSIYENLDTLVEDSQNMVGPKYTKTILNSHEVAKAKSKFIDNSPFDSYEIFLGNRQFSIMYYTAKLTTEEKGLAENMLKHIEFFETKKDLSGQRIESCKTWGNFFFD